jgi:flagellar motor switch protein FliM
VSGILSQDEVDALLRGVSEGEVETETDQPERGARVTPYDFTHQEKKICGRLPMLDTINRKFSQLFRSTFSGMLQKAANMRVVSTDIVKFDEFQYSLPVSSSLHIFRMESLRGQGLVAIERKLVFAVVDAIFGGTGLWETKITGRDFSAIETRVAKKVVLSALEDLERVWSPVHAVSTNYVRAEVDPRSAAIASPTDTVLATLFEIELGNISGSITICLPYTVIEPVIPKLKTRFQNEKMGVDEAWTRRLRTKLLQAEVEMVAELGIADITPRQLFEFEPGDTIMLGNDITCPLSMKVGGIQKFKGFLSVSRGAKAIRVTETVEREGQIHAG